tara:strand:- start:188 stop:1135 length:948 start_codon:yes stop_codon:yes gene_type:complete
MIKWVGSKIEYFKAKFKGDVEIDGNLNLHDTNIQAIQESATSFSDNDTSIMTSAAIADKIEAYGYSTATGDITGVIAGTGLSGGGDDGNITLNVSGLTVSEIAAAAIQTSGESFVDNDTSIMTSAAINDKINTKYANSIISFVGQATMLASGNWILPGKSGISNHTWNQDSGVNTETNATSEASIDRRWAHNGVRVPFACIVEGISCAISNAGGNRQVTVGLFFSRDADGTTAVTWGTHTGNISSEPILQIHADADNEGGSYSGRPSHAEVTGSNISMAAGDLFYPAIKLTGVTSEGSTDNVYATFNVHIKTLIS